MPKVRFVRLNLKAPRHAFQRRCHYARFRAAWHRRGVAARRGVERVAARGDISRYNVSLCGMNATLQRITASARAPTVF
ncbi:MAG TPA: hypothetical protein PKK24_10050, partial [Anaerolineaceae bacterium]|nr:hypothetical protein [Anaerolineaceae bacterium]